MTVYKCFLLDNPIVPFYGILNKKIAKCVLKSGIYQFWAIKKVTCVGVFKKCFDVKLNGDENRQDYAESQGVKC